MRVIKIFLLSVVGLGIIVFIILTILLSPVNNDSPEATDFVVTAGTSRSEIANQLASAGLIKSSFAFYLYSRVIGGKILPGVYEISASDSGSMIAEKLAEGKFKTAKIVLIEGWRATDIEDYLVNDRKLAQLTGFADKAEGYEGYLFPDTYEVKFDITVDELITLLRDNFTQRTKDIKINPEIVILASIVEREAKADDERAAIAGVYANRIKIGMRLEADPTIQYAKGDWKAVTLAEYRSVISPYNTYLNDGLPPGPICNPGLKSLEAAVSPETSSYLFFFHAKGQTFFSKTLEEHRTKVKQNF